MTQAFLSFYKETVSPSPFACVLCLGFGDIYHLALGAFVAFCSRRARQTGDAVRPRDPGQSRLPVLPLHPPFSLYAFLALSTLLALKMYIMGFSTILNKTYIQPRELP